MGAGEWGGGRGVLHPIPADIDQKLFIKDMWTQTIHTSSHIHSTSQPQPRVSLDRWVTQKETCTPRGRRARSRHNQAPQPLCCSSALQTAVTPVRRHKLHYYDDFPDLELNGSSLDWFGFRRYIKHDPCFHFPLPTATTVSLNQQHNIRFTCLNNLNGLRLKCCSIIFI